jgi:hypothetical protein
MKRKKGRLVIVRLMYLVMRITVELMPNSDEVRQSRPYALLIKHHAIKTYGGVEVQLHHS